MSTKQLRGRIASPFQFRLRTMLLMVTLCGALCAIMHAVGPIWSAIFCFFTLLVASHVAGNAIGTRLRDGATVSAVLDAEERPNFVAPSPGPSPAKHLALRVPLGRWIAVLTVIGVAGAGSIGAKFFAASTGPAAWAVGTVSSALLGGFATFLASSFLFVGLAAAWQAHSGKSAIASMPDVPGA